MDSKLVSKTNMGVMAAIIFIILLSQPRFFRFLINTTLGRATLVFLILGVACIHNIFGVVAVLAVIVIYNQSGMEYIEGLEMPKPTSMPAPPNATDDNTNVKSTAADDAVKATPDPKAMSDPKATPDPNVKPKTKNDKTKLTTESFIGGREGFNLLDRERIMQKGKCSNDIMGVADSRGQTDGDVEPNDPSNFAGTAAQF